MGLIWIDEYSNLIFMVGVCADCIGEWDLEARELSVGAEIRYSAAAMADAVVARALAFDVGFVHSHFVTHYRIHFGGRVGLETWGRV